MDNKKLHEAKRLDSIINEARKVEILLRTSTVRVIFDRHQGGLEIGELGEFIKSKFVKEKMIDAGIHAAMAMRTMAENDLEKL